MKFIKYTVGLVIALSVIPMVVVAVTKLDEPRLKTIEFEVIDINDNLITFSENTYNNIHSLAIRDNDDKVTNLITVALNDVDFVDVTMDYIPVNLSYKIDDNDTEGVLWDNLTDTNTAQEQDYNPTIGDKWLMTFDVSKPLPPLVKLLVGFAPLLLVGGVLLFMLNKRKLD